MIECPECGCEIEEVEDDDLDSTATLNIEAGAEAILGYYSPGFSLGDRLILEEAIRQCLVSRIGVPSSNF